MCGAPSLLELPACCRSIGPFDKCASQRPGAVGDARDGCFSAVHAPHGTCGTRDRRRGSQDFAALVRHRGTATRRGTHARHLEQGRRSHAGLGASRYDHHRPCAIPGGFVAQGYGGLGAHKSDRRGIRGCPGTAPLCTDIARPRPESRRAGSRRTDRALLRATARASGRGSANRRLHSRLQRLGQGLVRDGSRMARVARRAGGGKSRVTGIWRDSAYRSQLDRE